MQGEVTQIFAEIPFYYVLLHSLFKSFTPTLRASMSETSKPSHKLPKNLFVISGPKKIPIPLDEVEVPDFWMGSDQRTPAMISFS
jgi:hypothetical protein